MSLIKKCFFIFIALSLSACGKEISAQVPTTEPESTVPVFQTDSVMHTQTSDATPVSTSTSNPEDSFYVDCGSGGLIDVGYYFKDNYGNISPTQFVQLKQTDDEVRDYVKTITCLKHDEGWVSNPDEVENGYENEIIFFDKNGKAHNYRIIVGGHYVEPYDPTHKDITASLNGIDDLFYNVQDWIGATQNQFVTNGSRQIGLDIYLDDTHGDLSKVLIQVYKYRETNWQIFNALQTGEGYPDQVPDGFFLFATYSWLIEPE